MNKENIKNYLILIIILICTIVVTLVLSNVYKDKTKEISKIYEYSNKITTSEFNEYITENPDIIIYISDKYDLNYQNIESKLQRKIEELNLKNKFIYIEKKNIDSKFLKQIESKYKQKIDFKRGPIILVVLEGKIDNVIYLDDVSDINDIIEFGDFK